jgi:hypothetical protein
MVVTNLKQFGGQCLANRLDKQHDSNHIGHSGRGEADVAKRVAGVGRGFWGGGTIIISVVRYK